MSKMDSSSSARSWAAFSCRQYLGRRRMPVNMEYFSWLWRPIFTLSSTLRLLNSRMFWKVRATPMRLIWAGVLPWVSRPSSRMVPRVGWYTLVSRLNTVVLPAPLGPMRPAISVRPTVMLNSLTAVRPPKSMPRWLHSRMGEVPRSRSGMMEWLGTGTILPFWNCFFSAIVFVPPSGTSAPGRGRGLAVNGAVSHC